MWWQMNILNIGISETDKKELDGTIFTVHVI